MNKTYIRSPFFYVGDKYKILDQIIPRFPKEIDNYYEPFLGGGSVFLNINANKYFLNDIDLNLINIHRTLISKALDQEAFFLNIEKILKKYNFSRSFWLDVVPIELKMKYKKTYYAHYNKSAYLLLRDIYNNSEKKDYLILYILLIYGFNRMLRFNKNGNFNLPVGNVDWNKNVVDCLIKYFNYALQNDLIFTHFDFKEFLNLQDFKQNDFIYFDPPYLITESEYNKHWDEESEKELLKILDNLNSDNINFAISNAVIYRGKQNDIFSKWMKKYNVYEVKSNYINYHNNSQKNIREVLVTNY